MPRSLSYLEEEIKKAVSANLTERLQSADNAETRVARLDHIVDIAVAGGVVGIGELVAVLLLLSLIHIYPSVRPCSVRGRGHGTRICFR